MLTLNKVRLSKGWESPTGLVSFMDNAPQGLGKFFLKKKLNRGGVRYIW